MENLSRRVGFVVSVLGGVVMILVSLAIASGAYLEIGERQSSTMGAVLPWVFLSISLAGFIGGVGFFMRRRWASWLSLIVVVSLGAIPALLALFS